MPSCGHTQLMMMVVVVRLLLHPEGGKGVDLGTLLLLFTCFSKTHISFSFLFCPFYSTFLFGHEVKHLDKIMFVLIALVLGILHFMTPVLAFRFQ